MMIESPPLLQVCNLKTYFFSEEKVFRAVDDVSFRIDCGETVGIVGESGCGKSVTALSILRLIDPPGRIVNGGVFFNGVDILSLHKRSLQAYRGGKIAMIFQEPMVSLNPVLSCGSQIIETVMTHTLVKGKEAKNRAVELLELVRIPEPEALLGNYPHQLSGGMRQRVMIAIALASEPGLLIADEPTTALDVTVEAEIVELLKDLQTKLGMAILFITHDLGLVGQMADRVLVMYAGQIVEEGPTGAVLSSPLHPYSKALLDCLPSIDRTDVKQVTIPGTVPPADQYPSGCRFHPRCPIAKEECSNDKPLTKRVVKGRRVRCHFVD